MTPTIGVVIFILTVSLIIWRYWTMRRLNRKLESAVRDLQRAEEKSHRNEKRMKMLYEISQYRSEDAQGLLDFALHEILALTKSSIGYIYFYDEEKQEFQLNSWSKDVMKECSVVEKKTCYELAKTGIWGEAVRQRRPIILNDFTASHPLKKGYPAGHMELYRYLTIPVFQDMRIVSVVGIANREADYTEEDVLELTVIMDAVWKIVERQNSEQKLAGYAAALEQSNRELERFAYVSSHDLQEPLRKITSFVEVLEERYGDRFDEKGRQYMDFIVDGAERMRNQIRDLLAYSGLGLGESALADVDLNRVLDRIVTDMEFTARETGAKITRGFLPVVKADKAEIGAVLQNLIDNAIKFRGTEPPRIHLEAEGTPVTWVISVQDNGIGMEAEYFDRIFEMFQRLNPRSEYPGTGTGLAICKKLVESRGGRIWVESKAGEGSTFFFTIRR